MLLCKLYLTTACHSYIVNTMLLYVVTCVVFHAGMECIEYFTDNIFCGNWRGVKLTVSRPLKMFDKTPYTGLRVVSPSLQDAVASFDCASSSTVRGRRCISAGEHSRRRCMKLTTTPSARSRFRRV